MPDDRRLIEDYLPIKAISAEASREKSVRKGHISTLHLWWARRPLVACRAAVYGALVPASKFVPENGPDNKKQSLGRANAAKFIERLCKYPGNPEVISEAQRHILEAHAERLTQETGKKVTVEDIEEGRAPRPKVLDMFAGGGAIPLEALRLGCDAYALDLNPVAHIIELCTLVYPQKYGRPDPNARGMTGPKNEKGEATWGGLAEEVRYWGQWVIEKVKTEIGDLYPPIPDPKARPEEIGVDLQVKMDFAKDPQARLKIPAGYLTPVAYLWTRMVRCKNPSCGATVPLVRQTWLCKKKDRYAALKMIAPKGEKKVRFEVVEATVETGLGFDPEAFSKAGNATCPFCGTVADSGYVKTEGQTKQIDEQMMAQAFAEANRVLKPGGQMTIVYAHKTTLGWSTLVDALRAAGFTVMEAWPLETEKPGRLRSQESAALASSIFLVARKREGAETGSYEEDVRPELERIIRERVETLWAMGIAGADLKIAAVGAGMRAFTRFARVEYANGDDVPAEKFLAEVEGVVQDMLMEKIIRASRPHIPYGRIIKDGEEAGPESRIGTAVIMPSVSSIDAASRFYILWRYTYKAAEIDAGEAIVFTYGQHVELDGSNGLSTGNCALVEKKKGKYRLRDYTERGHDEKLGLITSGRADNTFKADGTLRADGTVQAALIDILHRILWLMENEPKNLPLFLGEARPDPERLRLIAEVLAGPGLSGKSAEEAGQLIGTTAYEQAALGKLLANWRALIESRLAGRLI